MNKVILFSIAVALTMGASVQSFAAKEKFERTKPHVNVGTIGHVDHGKTAKKRIQSSGSLVSQGG